MNMPATLEKHPSEMTEAELFVEFKRGIVMSTTGLWRELAGQILLTLFSYINNQKLVAQSAITPVMIGASLRRSFRNYIDSGNRHDTEWLKILVTVFQEEDFFDDKKALVIFKNFAEHACFGGVATVEVLEEKEWQNAVITATAIKRVLSVLFPNPTTEWVEELKRGLTNSYSDL